MSGPVLRLDLRLRGDWEGLEALREAVRAALGTQVTDPEFCLQLAMVAGELVENAIKHGSWASRPLRPDDYTLSLEVTVSEVAITVRQPAAGAGPRKLFDALARITKAESAEDAYAARMREVSKSLAPGGLGLPRIAHEAGCLLTARMTPEGLLEVLAMAPLPARTL